MKMLSTDAFKRKRLNHMSTQLCGSRSDFGSRCCRFQYFSRSPLTQSLPLLALSMGQIVGHCQFLSSKPAFDPPWSSSHDQLSIECILLSAAKTVAFTALLHGDADEYFIYALVLAGQLRRYSPNADRVLLLGPGVFRESLESRKALSLAGWTHLLSVEAIHTPHLDKTGSKRHRYVFTKRVLYDHDGDLTISISYFAS